MFGRPKKPPPPKKYARKVPSVMAIQTHPIHPMLVVFLIPFVGRTFPAAVAYLVLDDPFWALLSFWLNLGGLVMGVLAGLVGMGDFLILREVRNHVFAWSHFISGVMLLALATAGLGLRWPDPVAAGWPVALLASGVAGG